MSYPPAWCSALCGLPFKLGASGPAAFDCWGIVRAALWAGWQIAVPDHPEVRTMDADGQRRLVFISADYWFEIVNADARPGDVLVMGGSRDGLHAGIVVAPGWMLHAREGVASCLERCDRLPWRNAVRHVYRHRELVA